MFEAYFLSVICANQDKQVVYIGSQAEKNTIETLRRNINTGADGALSSERGDDEFLSVWASNVACLLSFEDCMDTIEFFKKFNIKA